MNSSIISLSICWLFVQNVKQILNFIAADRMVIDRGWFRIMIPWSRPGWDSLAVAQSFFQVAMHERVDIRDYQAVGRCVPVLPPNDR
jgi:hypothetical protein